MCMRINICISVRVRVCIIYMIYIYIEREREGGRDEVVNHELIHHSTNAESLNSRAGLVSLALIRATTPVEGNP